VRADEGEVRGLDAFITGNAGTGVRARGTDPGSGDVNLGLGQLCDNSPDLDATGTVTLTSVNQVCP
jgi:hypothetical protein